MQQMIYFYNSRFTSNINLGLYIYMLVDECTNHIYVFADTIVLIYKNINRRNLKGELRRKNFRNQRFQVKWN